MSRFRLWRLQRAYRFIAKHERKCGAEAIELRIAFAGDTHVMVDQVHKAHRITRTQRRQMKREMVGL